MEGNKRREGEVGGSCTKQGGTTTHNAGKVALRQIRCGHFRGMKQNKVKMIKTKEWEAMGHDSRKQKLQCDCKRGPQDMHHIIFGCKHTEKTRLQHTRAYGECLRETNEGKPNQAYEEMGQTEKMRHSINMKIPEGTAPGKKTRQIMFRLWTKTSKKLHYIQKKHQKKFVKK